MQPVAQAVALKGLKIHLGPELRAMFPVVLNMSISGDIELNGAADPASLKLAGIIHLDGGEVRAHRLFCNFQSLTSINIAGPHLHLKRQVYRHLLTAWHTGHVIGP